MLEKNGRFPDEAAKNKVRTRSHRRRSEVVVRAGTEIELHSVFFVYYSGKARAKGNT